MSNRARVALLVVLIVALIAGASTVFLIGSSNRKADRDAVLRFEAAVLADVREMNVIAGSLQNAVDSFKAGRLRAEALTTQARDWSMQLTKVAERLQTIRVPPAIGEFDPMFVPSARAWAEAASLYGTFASCAGSPNNVCLQTGRQADARAAAALDAYRAARRSLQGARERLGLGVSPNFEDPPR